MKHIRYHNASALGREYGSVEVFKGDNDVVAVRTQTRYTISSQLIILNREQVAALHEQLGEFLGKAEPASKLIEVVA